ncbi:hypothetical protein KEM56_001284 [Ascosphaera pollenicola]|nr:hypothetical protein KEM56_001284 [Ascosphaera pollenicola]
MTQSHVEDDVAMEDNTGPDSEKKLSDDAEEPANEEPKKDESAIQDVELDDFFSDDGDDTGDEAMAGAETNGNAAPQGELREAAPNPVAQVTSELMLAFYQRLYPFNTLFQWLNHGVRPSPDFCNREFAFTLQNSAYLRYQSFTTPDTLRKDVLRQNPSRFEIGPVYSSNPRDRKTLRNGSTFKPVSKELVFDIDVTDYDDIRTCCSGAKICSKCWTFVTMAAKVIDTALRQDFGFEHILWVYSGRRGAHAWVCDQSARNLSDDRRRAVVSYLELLKNGNQHGRRVMEKRPLHPHVSRSLDILRSYFASKTLAEQNTFNDPSQADHLLKLLPDQSLASALRKQWERYPSSSSKDRWADIDEVAKTTLGKGNSRAAQNEAKALRDAKQDIVLEYTYPRLDSEVTKKMIHLLKSPFVIHPGTGRVCVPIDSSQFDQFDPFSVPTVAELISEINQYDVSARDEAAEHGQMDDAAAEGTSANPSIRRVQDFEKTSLKPYIEFFRRFVAGLLKSERSTKRERDQVKKEDDDGAMEF